MNSHLPNLPRLKWHMLRRRKSDAAFLRDNLRAALAAGAACEVDIRFTSDGHALCLHDGTLDRETTGTGRVKDTPRVAIERLQQRAPDGSVLGSAPLFLDELVAIVSMKRNVVPASVQLDVKVRADALDTAMADHLSLVLGPSADRFIASAADWEVVQRLVASEPDLSAGFDPLAFYPRDYALDADGFRALAERTLSTAPGAAIYYLEANLVLAGLDAGVNLVEAVSRDGAWVDAWTVDPDRPGIKTQLRRLIDAGVRQITTNDPEGLGPLVEAVMRGRPGG